MKKIVLITVLLSLFLVVSCGDSKLELKLPDNDTADTATDDDSANTGDSATDDDAGNTGDTADSATDEDSGDSVADDDTVDTADSATDDDTADTADSATDDDTGDSADVVSDEDVMPVICVADEKRCDGDDLMLCNSAGTVESIKENCLINSKLCYDDYLACAAESTFTTDETNGWLGNGRLVGNVIETSSPKTIYNLSILLDKTTTDNIDFYIYKNTTGTTYQKVFEKTVSADGNGKVYYESGTVDIILESGKYIFGAVPFGTPAPRHYAGNKDDSLPIGNILGTVVVTNFTGPKTFNATHSTNNIVFMMKTISE